MKVEVGFVHLHSPLFFASRNWGEKLDVRNQAKGKFTMQYDRTEKELVIKCEGKETYIPSSNIVSFSPLTAEPLVAPISGKGANTKIKAQVSTPGGHVFDGPGAGQTGQSK